MLCIGADAGLRLRRDGTGFQRSDECPMDVLEELRPRIVDVEDRSTYDICL